MDSKVNIELMIAKDILDAICSGWIRYLNGDKRDYNETLNRIYKIITTRTNKSIEDKPMEQKNYKAIKELPSHIPLNAGLKLGYTYTEPAFMYLDIDKLTKDGYIEEVKEDTLGNVIYDLGLNFNRQQIFKQYIIKQKIELLKEVLEFIPISYSDFINNKISELQKEIK